MDRTQIEQKEFERQETISQAIHKADHIITQASDGDREELILLTALLCKEFADKIIFMVKVDAERKMIAKEYDAILGEKVARHSDWGPQDVKAPGV